MTEMKSANTSLQTIAELRSQFPDSPFLALGQTVFWDEPLKAVLRQMLDSSGLGGKMVVGVHDTDYFAKTKLRKVDKGRFALLAHNDGTTKDLWSAAGEISTLFGSETFPKRADYARYGVPFERVAKSYPAGGRAFIDEMTEAWGWRGLVYTGSRDLIVNRLSLREVGDGVLEMLTWGIDNALQQIQSGCCQDEARLVGEMVLDWCREYREANPDKCLTDLFQHCLPRLYTLLLGHAPENTFVTSTTGLLQLTPSTASLPRFRFVNLFLDPETREIALAAYNQAVSGSEMYTLDKFGSGALPFDVILPDRGRGTLRVTPRVVFIETRQPVAIGLNKPIESINDLAEVLHSKLGEDVTLVGKAVSLVSMLAQEFIFVFSEEGSMYVKRTRSMNDYLQRHGVKLDMRPLLRMRYHTWDALVVGKSTLRLPDHLVSAFGRQSITTQEFGESWQQVVQEQRELCAKIGSIRKPLELLDYLRDRDPLGSWDETSVRYSAAVASLRKIREITSEFQSQALTLHKELKALKARSLALQETKGEHFRETKDWSQAEIARREEFDRGFEQLESEKRECCDGILRLKQQRMELERGEEAISARSEMLCIENESELARLRLVRNGLLTIESLTHTNHRPSAWWLPMLDSSNEWFERIAATTEVYTEPLLS